MSPTDDMAAAQPHISYWTLAALAGILLLGLGLRVYTLADESPWWDEIVSLERLGAPNAAEFIRLERVSDPAMPPVYFLLEYYWAQIAGSSILAMRALSILIGLGAIFLIFCLGRAMYSDAAGLVAALCLALSMPHIYFSQEIRAYELATLLALASVYTFWQTLRDDRSARWTAHVMVNTLLVFTHLFAALLVVAEGCCLLLFRRLGTRKVTLWIAPHVVVAAILAAWVYFAGLGNINNASSWIPAPRWREAAMVLLIFAGGRPSNADPSPHLPTGDSLDGALAVLYFVAICGFVISAFHRHKKTPAEASGLLLLWWALPLMIAFILSYVWKPCFVYRYLLYSSLPMYIMAGAAFSMFETRTAKAALLGALIALYGYQLSALTTGPLRPDWFAVSRYLESKAKPEDTVIVFQGVNLSALEFNSTLPKHQIKCAEVWSGVCPDVLDAHARGDAWVVVWLWSAPAKIESCFPAHGLTFTHADFGGWPPLRVYHVPRAPAPGSGPA